MRRRQLRASRPDWGGAWIDFVRVRIIIIIILSYMRTVTNCWEILTNFLPFFFFLWFL